MQVLAHRGLHSGGIFENTIGAFRAGLASGADGIETDVRLTRDNQLVLVHDRMVRHLQLPISEMTWAELRRASHDDIPLLEEALAAIEPTFWNIEIKAGDAVKAFCQFAKHNPAPHRFLVSSFDYRIVAEVARETGLPCGLLTGHYVWALETLISPSRELKNIAAIIWNYDFLEPAQLTEAGERGFTNYVWNAQTAGDIAQCRDLNVEGIIVDNVPLAARIRDNL